VANFIGVFDCKADAKGRISIPAALKSQLLPMIEGEFVLKRAVYQNCLELYPRVEFDKFLEELRVKRDMTVEYDTFFRTVNAGVTLLRIEANGRIQIPKSLKTVSGIEKEVVLHSAFNKIEIWDKERYEEFLEESQSKVAGLANMIYRRDG